jgi:hypothetical protein
MEKDIIEKPWRVRHYERIKKRNEAILNKMSTEDFMDFIMQAIKFDIDDVIEFNKKWDKEHYKVFYLKEAEEV